jgi:hypothetical protein
MLPTCPRLVDGLLDRAGMTGQWYAPTICGINQLISLSFVGRFTCCARDVS